MNYFDILRTNFIDSYAKANQDDEYYYLYKHFSFGEKDSANEYSVLGTFLNCNLLFSKPNSFNDPFDCLSIIDYDLSRITKSELEEYIGKPFTNKEFKLNKDRHIRQLKNLDIVKNWGDEKRNNMHLVCFNNNPLNILMWSHYARNHQGFMIEFKFKKKGEFNFAGLPVPVLYNDEFPQISYSHNIKVADCIENTDLGSEVVIKLFASKAKVWSYENEFRLLNTDKNIDKTKDKILVPIENDLFVSVIFGAQAWPSAITKTMLAIEEFNKLNNKNVKTYKAKMKNDKYELYVPDHPRLDKK